MAAGSFYGITAFVCALICAALYRCNNAIFERKNRVRTYFSFLLVNFIICGFIDALWGLMYFRMISYGRIGFVITSFVVHFYVVFIAACWCIFITSYFGFKESRPVMILQCIPLALALLFLATQAISGDTVFVIDEAGNYIGGPFRSSMFIIHCSYYVVAVFKVIYFLITHYEEYRLRHRFIIFACSIVPLPFAVLQFFYIDGPYSALGFMFAAVYVFNCMMVIDKNRNMARYETISKETYRALEALSDGFIAVVLIDLVAQTVTAVKSYAMIDTFLEGDAPAREKVMNCFTSIVTPEFLGEIKDFANIDLLPEKMDNRRSVSAQYRSKEYGWCVATFIAAERDAGRNLKKVVLAVQSIDETKKKEVEYEEALSRAYQNKNAVFAELIKMQSTGVVASRDRRIIVVNDAALDMFGYEDCADPIGMDVFEFWKSSPIKTSDEVKQKFFDLEENGGQFSYETVSFVEGRERDMRHLRADVKRIELLDGSVVMLTCFTDITAGKMLEDKLRTLSETDALTNIANRRCGESQIRLLMEEGIGGIYCLFDVNGFKHINDNFGHQTGDDTLVAVADAIKHSFRSDDIIMRLGGDEFAIYMRGVQTSDLAKIRVARLFENIARIELPNIPKGSVTISLGAVLVKSVDGTVSEEYDDVYKRADARMYECKGRPGSNLSIEEIIENEKSETSS